MGYIENNIYFEKVWKIENRDLECYTKDDRLVINFWREYNDRQKKRIQWLLNFCKICNI